jgi:chromosomal replication initiation ATPase DnaA
MTTAVPTFNTILVATATHLKIPAEVIKNKEYRTRQVTQARHIASLIARKVAFLSDSQISIHFDQNRENVSMCVRRLERLAANDPILMNRITDIISSLQTG